MNQTNCTSFLRLLRFIIFLKSCCCYLLGRGEVGAVRTGGAVLGGGAAGDVVRVRQRPALHLCQHTLLVQTRLEEPRVAVKLHQVKNLNEGKKRFSG